MRESDESPVTSAVPAPVSPVTHRSMPYRIVMLTVVLGVLAGLSAAVMLPIWGSRGAETVGWTLLLCLPPGWLVFLAEPLYRLPHQAVYGSLFGSLVRIGWAMLGVLLVLHFRPEIPRIPFIACLAVQYLGGLALETWWVYRALPLRQPRATTTPLVSKRGPTDA
jgi:hypothetical protein